MDESELRFKFQETYSSASCADKITDLSSTVPLYSSHMVTLALLLIGSEKCDGAHCRARTATGSFCYWRDASHINPRQGEPALE